MPAFDFECNGKCNGETFETIIYLGEDDPKQCPVCGSTKINKLFNFTCELKGLTRKSQQDEPPGLMIIRHTIIDLG